MATKKTKKPKPEYQMMRVRKTAYLDYKRISEVTRTSILNVADDAIARLKETVNIPQM